MLDVTMNLFNPNQKFLLTSDALDYNIVKNQRSIAALEIIYIRYARRKINVQALTTKGEKCAAYLLPINRRFTEKYKRWHFIVSPQLLHDFDSP